MRAPRTVRTILAAVTLAAFSALSLASTVLAASGGADWPFRFR